MTKGSLSERLTHLRGLIADHHDTNALLLEADQLINFQKHHSKQDHSCIDALRQENRELNRKFKELKKAQKEQHQLVDNLRNDLEIVTIKWKNLQEKVKQQGHTITRQTRAEAKREQKQTSQCQVQVEILSGQLMDRLIKNYRTEMKENEKLRQEMQTLKEQATITETEVSITSTCTGEEALDQAESASFSEIIQEMAIEQSLAEMTIEQSLAETADENHSALSRFWTKSKQLISYYLKDQ